MAADKEAVRAGLPIRVTALGAPPVRVRVRPRVTVTLTSPSVLRVALAVDTRAQADVRHPI